MFLKPFTILVSSKRLWHSEMAIADLLDLRTYISELRNNLWRDGKEVDGLWRWERWVWETR